MSDRQAARAALAKMLTSSVPLLEVVDVIDAIVDVAVDEAMERIANRAFEKRSTERRVGYERNKKL